MRKFLSFILTIAIIATCLIGVTATPVIDHDMISHVEAVDVLTAINVITGYPDGTFRPEGNVTRAEMAKMVAFVMNKGEDVNDLYKNACLFTDSVNHWAAGYIAYCAQAGIICGKNAETFDPDADVTGVEAAKMLLVILGYNADTEGFKGVTWASAVLSKAADAHLIGSSYDLTADMSQPLNREDTAQMIFNALKADMVRYKTSGLAIQIGETTISTGSETEKKTDTNPRYNNIGKDGVVSGSTVTYTVQLGEEKFDSLVLAAANTVDAMGRPAASWRYENKDIALTANTATLTYKDVVKSGTLYADLGKLSIDTTPVNPTAGTSATTLTTLHDGKYQVVYYVNGAVTSAPIIASANKTDIGVVGDTIEVYKDTVNELITIVQTNYYISTIANVYATRTNTAGDVTTAGYITLDSPIVVMSAPKVEEGQFTTGNSFATTEFTSADIGSYVIYTYSANSETATGYGYAIQTVEKAKSTTGLFTTAIAGTAPAVYESVIVNGTSYKVSTNVTAPLAQNTNVTLYFDPNGNVQHMTGAASNDFVYLIAGDIAAGTFGQDTNKARLVFTDGSVKDVTTNKSYTEDILYTYTVDSKGTYTLTPVATIATGTPSKTPIVNNNVEFVTNDTNKLNYFKNTRTNNETLFIVETYDSVNDTAIYTTYKGVNKLPTITDANYSTWPGTYTSKTTSIGDSITARNINAVAVTPNGDLCASVVYVFGATVTNTSSNVTALYMTAKDPLTRDVNNNNYYTVKAVVNNTETTVKVDVAAHTSGLVVANSLTMNGDIITGFNDVTVTNPAYNKSYSGFVYKDNDGYTGTYKAGIISLDNPVEDLSIDSSVPVYVYNLENNTFTVTTIGAYTPTGEPSTNDKVVITSNTTDFVPTALYVFETNA